MPLLCGVALIQKFFAGLYADAQKQYRMYKIDSILQSINHIGADAHIADPLSLIGGKHISIDNRFFCGAESRIEAWDYYKQADQRFSPQILIGNDVRINGRCHIGAIQSVIIGNNVLMGSGVFITDHAHGNSSAEQIEIVPDDRPLYSKGPVIIQNNVWVCEGAMILPDIVVGEKSIVAANAVVTEKCSILFCCCRRTRKSGKKDKRIGMTVQPFYILDNHIWRCSR